MEVAGVSIKGEFLSNKANVLIHTLHERGWDVKGTLNEFTATYGSVEIKYREGDVCVCSQGEEVMHLRITDVM